MINIRRFAIVLMTVGVVAGAVYATGAFTSLTATRDANIQVVGDSSSYLALQPAPGPNGEYATLRGGKLHISLTSSSNGAGKGVNRNAVTVVRNIFTITNKGSQLLGVWLTDTTNAVTFKGGSRWQAIEGRKQAITLQPGQTLFVGLTVDTHGSTDGDLIKSVTIHADADVSGETSDSGTDNGETRHKLVTSPPPTGKDSIQKHDLSRTKSGSDGDLLNRRAETVWGTDPTSADTDEDGIPDLRDPNPTRDNTMPIIEAQSRQWSDYFILDVSGNGEITNIDIKAHFQPIAPWDDAQWVSHAGNVEKLENGKYRVNIKDWGLFNENPGKYQITITDEKGHTLHYRVDLTGDKPQLQTIAVPALTVTAASPVPGDAIVVAGGLALVAGVGIIYEHTLKPPEPITKKQLSTEVQISDTVATYKPGEVDPRIDMPVRLPSGRTYEAPNGNKRRFGKEQIVQLPGINNGNAEETVGEILKTPSAIRHQGEYTIVIGDNPRGPGKLKLWLQDGIVMKGMLRAEHPVVEEYPDSEYGNHNGKRDDTDTVLREDKLEHIQNGHPTITKQEIRKTIEDPDELWVSQTDQGWDRYMWVKTINGRVIIVRGTHIQPKGDVVEIGTAYPPVEDGQYEDGYKHVQDWVNRNNATRIYP